MARANVGAAHRHGSSLNVGLKMSSAETSASLEDEVIALVAEYSNYPAENISSQTTLLGDIGIDGDDGDEILKAFMERFQVDMSSIRPVHFGIEGFLPWAPLMWIHQAWITYRDKSSTPES